MRHVSADANPYAIVHGQPARHPSCFDNLAASLAPCGVAPDTIPTTFNVFIHVEITAAGQIRVLPRSRAGDYYIDLRAEMISCWA